LGAVMAGVRGIKPATATARAQRHSGYRIDFVVVQSHAGDRQTNRALLLTARGVASLGRESIRKVPAG